MELKENRTPLTYTLTMTEEEAMTLKILVGAVGVERGQSKTNARFLFTEKLFYDLDDLLPRTEHSSLYLTGAENIKWL